MPTTLNSLQDLLHSIPEVKPEDKNHLQLEDMEKIHHSLTLDNPLTYYVFMDRRPDLSKEYRNTTFKIIQKNISTTYEVGCSKMEYVNKLV